MTPTATFPVPSRLCLWTICCEFCLALPSVSRACTGEDCCTATSSQPMSWSRCDPRSRGYPLAAQFKQTGSLLIYSRCDITERRLRQSCVNLRFALYFEVFSPIESTCYLLSDQPASSHQHWSFIWALCVCGRMFRCFIGHTVLHAAPP